MQFSRALRALRPSLVRHFASPADGSSTNGLAPPPAPAQAGNTTEGGRRSSRPRKAPTGVASEVGLAAASLLPPKPLYRRILRAHHSLPLEMKSLGDQYVKDEFRRHAAIDNPLQIVGFLTQWKVYLDQLENQQGGHRGRQLDMDQFGKLSDEQLYQLHELMTVTRELYDPEKAQSQPPGGNDSVHNAVQEALDRVKKAQGDGEGQQGEGQGR